ncbi:MAG TPA: hypothetical protein ENJ84_12645 [Gammaproteobacteria bacterium]|nr:hypothetical protein [Gammaproteobacteria bacterium]
MGEKRISAASAQNSARIMDLGNLASILLPILIPFWFGASIFIYAMNRHHPNPRVGHYTQQAAYRFYGLVGAIIPVATFFPVNITYYLITWAVLAAIIIPWTLYALRQIRQETWHDTLYQNNLETM